MRRSPFFRFFKTPISYCTTAATTNDGGTSDSSTSPPSADLSSSSGAKEKEKQVLAALIRKVQGLEEKQIQQQQQQQEQEDGNREQEQWMKSEISAIRVDLKELMSNFEKINERLSELESKKREDVPVVARVEKMEREFRSLRAASLSGSQQVNKMVQQVLNATKEEGAVRTMDPFSLTVKDDTGEMVAVGSRVLVSGVPATTQPHQVRQYLSSAGPVESVVVYHTKHVAGGGRGGKVTKRDFIVSFTCAADAARAIESLHGSRMQREGPKLSIKPFLDPEAGAVFGRNL